MSTGPNLRDKACVITGAASGIGWATAAAFCDEGANVVMVDRHAANLDAHARKLTEGGGRVEAVPADLADAAGVRQVFQRCASRFGPADVVVNVHGIRDFADTDIATVPHEVFDRIIAANLRSFFLVCQEAARMMRAAGRGSIVNVSSTAALRAPVTAPISYSASKGAINAMSRAISQQLAAEGIRCNVVCPGAVDTPMVDALKTSLGVTKLPVRPGTLDRVASPEEVARLIIFLAGDEGSFVTGATYTIDGGTSQH